MTRSSVKDPLAIWQAHVVPEAFTPLECDGLMAYFDKVETRPGGIYRRGENNFGSKVVDETYRKAREYQVEPNELPEFRARMAKIGRRVNDEVYGFDLDGEVDRMLYLHYEQDGFFARHKDGLQDTEYGYKKLVMVLQLSPMEDFRGGVLNIEGNGPQPQGQGTIIIFPILLAHDVCAVNGNRKMVVNWCTSTTGFR